jgi:hypothetical protein
MIIIKNRFLTSASEGVGLNNQVNIDSITSSNLNDITIPTGKNLRGTSVGSIYSLGTVLQSVTVRYDVQLTFATGTGINGVELSGMRARITPISVNSLILCQFQLFTEPARENNMFRVFKNGVLAEGVLPSYNINTGNQHWSGISMIGSFEIDYSSTPVTTVFYYHDFPSTTSQVFYSPAIKNASGSNVTTTLNRSIGSAGVSGNEAGVSYTTLWEIAQ